MMLSAQVPELGDTVFIVLRKQPLIFLHWSEVDNHYHNPDNHNHLDPDNHDANQVPPCDSAHLLLVFLLRVHSSRQMVRHVEHNDGGAGGGAADGGGDCGGNDDDVYTILSRFVVMNFIVHSIMYSYYALRAMRFNFCKSNQIK